MDNLDLDDLTIPDVIKLPNSNKYNNNSNNKLNSNNNTKETNKNNSSSSSIISNIKVRGFSYLNGTSNGSSNGPTTSGISNGTTSGVSNGQGAERALPPSSSLSYGDPDVGKKGAGDRGRLSDYIKKQQEDRRREDSERWCSTLYILQGVSWIWHILVLPQSSAVQHPVYLPTNTISITF